ncbi:uncharacterized protein LOC141660714 [Apium graveolens]|uniref:uncharacterized protein LOC141660714 n=1 Tax=Apium graveolens TaxID=4045 RepID=UPI003D7B2ECA
MNRRFDARKNITEEYKIGVDGFIKFAVANTDDSKGRIRCPCNKCGNFYIKNPHDVILHLYRHGIMPAYTTWNFHEKSVRSRVDTGTSSMNIDNTHDDFYDAREMLGDFSEANNNFENMDKEPNATTKSFYMMLDSASEPLYPNCTSFTTLSFVSKLHKFKHRHGCSNKGFDELLELIGSVLPEDHKLPLRYYDVKKLVSGLSMGYEKFDTCVNDCMLFYNENSEKIHCDICDEDRYKMQKDYMKKLIPKKILRYFPLTLRLQRLFMSEKTAKCMIWHHDRATVEGLSSDGFDPFRDAHAREYTVWPVIVVVYNLPPSMCTKAPYMFMPLLIPGPNDPTKDFHVYLRLLIDELKMLWCTGVETYDRVSRSNFTMKVALMWTINDFPALGMLSGWSNKGKLACPVCMGLVKAKQLKHGGKSTFYGSRAKILYEQIQFPPPGKTIRQKPSDYGVTHNWTQCSPFFELPYWETLNLRHNIDIMHTEKNVFDNIFYTMLGDKKKTKENSNARNDCKELGVHRELWIRDDGTMPTAPFVLGRDKLISFSIGLKV